MDVTLSPSLLEGQIPAIPSKSHAHRVLLCAGLGDRPCRIRLGQTNDDIEATLACLESLGAQISRQDDLLTLQPIRPGQDPVSCDVRESGTSLRLLLPILAGLGLKAQVQAAGRLPDRPLTDLVRALRKQGATIGESWPLAIEGPLYPGTFSIPGNVSSQYLSGLLLAAPLLGGDVRIVLTSPLESKPYVDLTLAVMADFGIQVQAQDQAFLVPGGQAYRTPEETITIEGDWSQAAFFLVAGAFAGPVTLTGLKESSSQGDKAILDALRAYGAQVSSKADAITVAQGTQAPLHIPMTPIPDLLPILSILAAGAQGDSLFDEALRLRYKESDRLESTQAMIQALGGQAQTKEDRLTVHGYGGLKGGHVDAYRDHRIVMAAAIATGICQDPVHILGAEAVTKSYPHFFADFQKLGGIVHGL